MVYHWNFGTLGEHSGLIWVDLVSILIVCFMAFVFPASEGGLPKGVQHHSRSLNPVIGVPLIFNAIAYYFIYFKRINQSNINEPVVLAAITLAGYVSVFMVIGMFF
jgi:hypothetical protein